MQSSHCTSHIMQTARTARRAKHAFSAVQMAPSRSRPGMRAKEHSCCAPPPCGDVRTCGARAWARGHCACEQRAVTVSSGRTRGCRARHRVNIFLPGATPALRTGCQGGMSASRVRNARVLPSAGSLCWDIPLVCAGREDAVGAHEKSWRAPRRGCARRACTLAPPQADSADGATCRVRVPPSRPRHAAASLGTGPGGGIIC